MPKRTLFANWSMNFWDIKVLNRTGVALKRTGCCFETVVISWSSHSFLNSFSSGSSASDFHSGFITHAQFNLQFHLQCLISWVFDARSKVQVTFHRSTVQVNAPSITYQTTQIPLHLVEHFVKRLGLGDTFKAVHLSVSWWPALWPVQKWPVF